MTAPTVPIHAPRSAPAALPLDAPARADVPGPATPDPARAPAAGAPLRRWPRGARKDRATLRLTDAEWAAVQARVRETGRTTGRYLRELALGTIPHARPTQANADLVRALAKIGNNLNQLAHVANATDRLADEARLVAVLDELLGVIRRVG